QLPLSHRFPYTTLFRSVDPLEILRLFHVYVSFYTLKFSLMVVIGVIQYYRYAIYYSLRQMNARLENLSVKRLEVEVQKLAIANRSEEHTSELQSRFDLV